MKLISQKSIVNGQVRIPGSKSHTIRALIISTLANGNSVLINPLESGDTISCLSACRSLGAEINQEKDRWSVIGKGIPDIPDDIIDVGNSGTTGTTGAAPGIGGRVSTGAATTMALPSYVSGANSRSNPCRCAGTLRAEASSGWVTSRSA